MVIVSNVVFDAVTNDTTDRLLVKGLFGDGAIVALGAVPVRKYLFIETLADGGVVADGLPQPDNISIIKTKIRRKIFLFTNLLNKTLVYINYIKAFYFHNIYKQ